MASTSTVELEPRPTEETRNWMEMPHDLMGMILQRLGAIEILNNTQKVCTTWRRICKDPAMWKVIDMRCSIDAWYMDYGLRKMAKHAVDRSCGGLISINIEYFGTDDLLDHISKSSNQLKRLRLVKCRYVTGKGLSEAVTRLPELENLHLFYMDISVEAIETIGCSCPLLKSFKLNKENSVRRIENNEDALAIATHMPHLRYLQLFGNKMTNEGLQAILRGCTHLQSLDLRRCFNVHLQGNVGKLRSEQIKDLKRPFDSTECCEFDPEFDEYDPLDDIFSSWYLDMDDYDKHDYVYETELDVDQNLFHGGIVFSEDDNHGYEFDPFLKTTTRILFYDC